MGVVQQLFTTLAAYITRIKHKAIKLSVFKRLHVSFYFTDRCELKIFVSDSKVVVNKVHKSVTKTDLALVKPVERSEACSLKNAIDVNIDGKLFCLAHVGQTKHKDAFQLCQSINSTLPLPRSLKEHYHFIQSFKRLGIDTKMEDLSTKIILDVRRLSNKGRVS